jgi:glycosyl transferase family 87
LPAIVTQALLLSMVIARKHLAMPVVIAGAALAGALYAYHAGEDINWDWQNYHEYGAFALLRGHFDTDVAPGGFQSFLNPLVYVLPYLLRHSLAAPWWGVWLGALHGLNLALIYWISRLLIGKEAGALPILAAVTIAAFGPMTLSEVGTSFADITTALPILAAIALLLADREPGARRLAAAGFLIGAAAGLKLTNATFLIGAGLSLILATRPLAAMLCFGSGGIAGVLATGGVWAFKLWRDFGSPLFPFYNASFRSPEAPPVTIVDTRFMPHGLLDALAYPFDWLIGEHPSSEYPFRDPRFAVVIVLLLLTIVIGGWRRRDPLQSRDKQLLLFFWTSYVLWMLAFSIHRYAIPLELLSAPLIVLLLIRLMQAWQPRRITPLGSSRVCQAATVITALSIALWSQPAEWMRRPWSDPYRPQLADALRKPATFMLLQKPLGYIVPQLSEGSRAYQLSELVMSIVPGGVLDRRIRAGLADPLPGGLWALYFTESRTDNPPRLDLLAAYDLKLDPSRRCERIPGADRVEIAACPLLGPANTASTAGLSAADRSAD